VNALTQRLVVEIILVMSHLMRARHVIRIAVQGIGVPGGTGILAM